LWSSSDIIRIIKLKRTEGGGHVERIIEGSNIYTNLVGKRLGKRPLGRPWFSNGITMDLKENGYEGVDWIDLAQDRY
jgi:hypothetical protein